jgi:hypothetical protein
MTRLRKLRAQLRCAVAQPAARANVVRGRSAAAYRARFDWTAPRWLTLRV